MTACGCSAFGSVREDCEQMTGRCVCRTGVQGQKCTVCADHRRRLGPNGCSDRKYPIIQIYCFLYWNISPQRPIFYSFYVLRMPLKKDVTFIIIYNVIKCYVVINIEILLYIALWWKGYDYVYFLYMFTNCYGGTI